MTEVLSLNVSYYFQRPSDSATQRTRCVCLTVSENVSQLAILFQINSPGLLLWVCGYYAKSGRQLMMLLSPYTRCRATAVC